MSPRLSAERKRRQQMLYDSEGGAMRFRNSSMNQQQVLS